MPSAVGITAGETAPRTIEACAAKDLTDRSNTGRRGWREVLRYAQDDRNEGAVQHEKVDMRGCASDRQDCRMSLVPILVILSAAKDLTERSDTGRVAGVRSFAALRTTGVRTQARRSPSQHRNVDTFGSLEDSS